MNKLSFVLCLGNFTPYANKNISIGSRCSLTCSDASRNTIFLCFSWFCNKLIVPLQANLKHITILSSEEDYEQIL